MFLSIKEFIFLLKTIYTISNFVAKKKTVITIGTFDGVHYGHQKILKKLVKSAKKEGKNSVLLTFFPHPRTVLQKGGKIELINTIEERIQLLKKTGIDFLVIHPFDKEFSKLTAFHFVRDVLVNQLHVSKLIIGYDHHFGKNREGNITQLTEYSNLFNFEIEEIKPQDINAVAVSSTKIRTALHNGNLKTANTYLGYHFMINGVVVGGMNLGEKIGFPTANIHVSETYKLVPKTGVYIIKSTIKGKVFFGMMNIGNRPTVNGKHQTIEVHFFDFNDNLYGKTLTIEFLYFLRDEKKFDGIESLANQLKKDKKKSLKYIQENKQFLLI